MGCLPKYGLKSLILALLLCVGPAQSADKVNINTASAAEIERTLINIGASRAQAIVEYRQQHGDFKSADELAKIRGIGLRTVERNRDLITVDGAPDNTATTTNNAPATPLPRR